MDRMGYEVSASSVHRVTMEDRRSLTVSGVEDMGAFDETHIELTTSQGVLSIVGEELHIEKLALDSGELKVEGNIQMLSYEDGEEKNVRGFFSRLFG